MSIKESFIQAILSFDIVTYCFVKFYVFVCACLHLCVIIVRDEQNTLI